LAHIKEILGKEIALSIFFQAQTIEELAKVLQQDRWSTRRPSVVMLQRGRSTAPLFIIFPGYHIAELVRHLGPDQPVYGILQMGLDGKASQDTMIRDMATHCIKEIVSLQQEGPYLLAGRCIGGLVAFEIAQQLQAKDQRVALLVLFDTPAPINLKTHTWPFTIDDSTTGASDRNLLQPRRNQRLLFAFLKILYKAYLGGESFLPQTLQRVNHQAFRKYAPSVYQGRITYFWARESRFRHYSYGRQWSWGQLAGGGLDLHPVPGNRTTLMREPHVQVLAGRLRAVLEAISK
jgi:thioesterase domain-containing protein